MQRKAIIIGSGIGGMAVAARLATQGFAVRVYEKNSGPGGKVTAFEKDGFRFDAGPSLFTAPEFLEELFEDTGENLQEYLQYAPVDNACKYFYEDGTVINAFCDADAFAEEASAKTGAPKTTVLNYLARASKLSKGAGSMFLNHSLQKSSTWFNRRLFPALRAVRLPILFSSLARYNRKNFKSPHLQQLFNRFATYSGSDPFRASAMLNQIADMEHGSGTFYPAGGMVSIPQALHKLCLTKGVQFYFDAPVQRIIYRDSKAKGVVVNEKNEEAAVVVSNADAAFTYSKLITHNSKFKKLTKRERSSSAVVFYWGISKEFAGLGLHNIFFSDDYAAEFRSIFKTKELPDDPTIYVNITSVLEKSHAPANQANWFLMVNVPAGVEYDDEEFISKIRQRILAKLNRMLGEDVSKLIRTESVMHPKTIADNSYAFEGAIYGNSFNGKLAAFKRHPNFTSYIKNLYLCGGTVHPGGGIPLCLKSAKITAALIAKDFRKVKAH